MSITASKLRENIYRLLDEVLATGVPLEVKRNDRTLWIVADGGPDRLSGLVRRTDAVIGDSEDFVALDWSAQWRP